MHKLPGLLAFVASASVLCRALTAAELPLDTGFSAPGAAVVLVGGMGGMTGGGMTGGGKTGGGMGGMTGGGMGGMSGGDKSGNMGGMFGGVPGTYGSSDPGGSTGAPQYYLCVTPYDQCSLALPPGSLRSGSACACAEGHRGTIK